MNIIFFILFFFASIAHSADSTKKAVSIDPEAPLVHQDDYTSYQTPPTPEIETDLFKQYNENVNETRRINILNLIFTGLSTTTAVIACFIPDGSDEIANTWKRATIVSSVITVVASGLKTCMDCRRKPKVVANYSRGTTPRHGYPASVSKGPSPLIAARTLE